VDDAIDAERGRRIRSARSARSADEGKTKGTHIWMHRRSASIRYARARARIKARPAARRGLKIALLLVTLSYALSDSRWRRGKALLPRDLFLCRTPAQSRIITKVISVQMRCPSLSLSLSLSLALALYLYLSISICPLSPLPSSPSRSDNGNGIISVLIFRVKCVIRATRFARSR